ncbi:MAG: glycosyltransferase family 4 protein, partial [Gemmatimonadaceae bacterium]
PRGGRRMRLTLAISSLAAGGAEHVLSALASHWAEHEWPVTFVTLDSTSTDFYKLHPSVDRIALNASRDSQTLLQAVSSNVDRVQRLRTVIRDSQPDVVISFMTSTNVLALIAARKERVPVVVSERADPRYYPIQSAWAGLRRLTYPWASAIVVQTPEVGQWAKGFVRPEAVKVIPNFVVAPADGFRRYGEPIAIDAANARPAVRQVMGMGRLDDQKGFDLLIRAFAMCRKGRPGWQLTILGEGVRRAEFEALARKLDVASHVRFLGRVEDPTRYLREADLFVLSSRYEGFPNALLEAMALGLPVIATDCPSGPAHIVRHSVDGLLVPNQDVGALASSMAALMDDESGRMALGAEAISVTERFNVDRIITTWETLLTDVATRSRVHA